MPEAPIPMRSGRAQSCPAPTRNHEPETSASMHLTWQSIVARRCTLRAAASLSALQAATALSAFLVVGCTQSPCENNVVSGLPSPDGADIAFVFRRSCGTPSGWGTDVSVIDMHRSLRSGPGNVLVVGGEQPVKVSWRGPKRLLVTGFRGPIHLQDPQVNSVTIEFRQIAE
jgi:hypothetical protein